MLFKPESTEGMSSAPQYRYGLTRAGYSQQGLDSGGLGQVLIVLATRREFVMGRDTVDGQFAAGHVPKLA